MKELYDRNGSKWPLVVLHNKRLRALRENPSHRRLLEEWIDKGVLYTTPNGSNDDWYTIWAFNWLTLIIMLGCFFFAMVMVCFLGIGSMLLWNWGAFSWQMMRCEITFLSSLEAISSSSGRRDIKYVILISLIFFFSGRICELCFRICNYDFTYAQFHTYQWGPITIFVEMNVSKGACTAL